MPEQKTTIWHNFPNGLVQAEGAYRFSADALLLAEFATERILQQKICFADLGTGCGVVSFALLKNNPQWYGVGIDFLEESIQVAKINAEKTGCSENFYPMLGDISQASTLKRMRSFLKENYSDAKTGQFDLVMANPPWLCREKGRISPSDLREKALFDDGTAYPVFFNAADSLLANKGRLLCVGGAARTKDMLDALPARLNAEHMRFVFTKKHSPAEFVILEARKNGKGVLNIDQISIESR